MPTTNIAYKVVVYDWISGHFNSVVSILNTDLPSLRYEIGKETYHEFPILVFNHFEYASRWVNQMLMCYRGRQFILLECAVGDLTTVRKLLCPSYGVLEALPSFWGDDGMEEGVNVISSPYGTFSTNSCKPIRALYGYYLEGGIVVTKPFNPQS